MTLRSIAIAAALTAAAATGAAATERAAPAGNPAFADTWRKPVAAPKPAAAKSAPAVKPTRPAVEKATLPDGRSVWKTRDTTVVISGSVEFGVAVGGRR